MGLKTSGNGITAVALFRELPKGMMDVVIRHVGGYPRVGDWDSTCQSRLSLLGPCVVDPLPGV